MKLIIAGSRDLVSYKLVEQCMTFVLPPTCVISGGAHGIDQTGEIWAELHDIPVVVFPADWKAYGMSAGHLRNSLMAEEADAAVVIHNGSRGSKDMIKQMVALGKPVYVFDETGGQI